MCSYPAPSLPRPLGGDVTRRRASESFRTSPNEASAKLPYEPKRSFVFNKTNKIKANLQLGGSWFQTNGLTGCYKTLPVQAPQAVILSCDG